VSLVNRPTVPTNGSKVATPPIVIPSSAKGFVATPSQTNPHLCSPHLGPIIPEGIILASISSAALPAPDLTLHQDPLDAFHRASIDGMGVEDNVDVFLNLQRIEDIDMSTDASKHKRCEEGEEVNSHASNP